MSKIYFWKGCLLLNIRSFLTVTELYKKDMHLLRFRVKFEKLRDIYRKYALSEIFVKCSDCVTVVDGTIDHVRLWLSYYFRFMVDQEIINLTSPGSSRNYSISCNFIKCLGKVNTTLTFEFNGMKFNRSR